MITKEELFNKFIKACHTPLNVLNRKLGVETQFNRRRWDIDVPNFGKIAIVNAVDSTPYIVVWIPVFLHHLYGAGEFKFPLTSTEYRELINIYKGGFKDDVAYLKRIGVTDFDD